VAWKARVWLRFDAEQPVSRLTCTRWPSIALCLPACAVGTTSASEAPLTVSHWYQGRQRVVLIACAQGSFELSPHCNAASV